MNKDLKKIIKEIECYQNEDMCMIMLSQKENKALLDYITNLQNNWYDLKTYCKLERHESDTMKEGEIYNKIITKMEQLERGE